MLDIRDRSIKSEEAQLSGSEESAMQTPRGSCGSNDKKTMLFGDNDKLFAKEIHYLNVSNTPQNDISEKYAKNKMIDRSQDFGVSQEFLTLLQGVSTPKTERRELVLGKRINNADIDQHNPAPINVSSTPKEVLTRSPLG